LIKKQKNRANGSNKAIHLTEYAKRVYRVGAASLLNR